MKQRTKTKKTKKKKRTNHKDNKCPVSTEVKHFVLSGSLSRYDVMMKHYEICIQRETLIFFL